MPAERLAPSSIRNKIKREDVHRSQKRQKGQEKLKRRLALAEAERKDPELKKQRLATNAPRTLDNMREFDPSMVTANPVASTSTATPADDSSDPTPEDEATYDISLDPFASYFNSDADPSIPPKVLITTSSRATKVTFDFCEELVGVVPGGEFIRRKKNKGFEIGKIAGWAAGRGYSSLLVVNEDRKQPNAITMIHLPMGPTAYFKLTSVQLTKEISGHARASPHYPELVLNGFVTRLGHAVGRMFQTLFPPLPEFEGRQVVTLHNQRDFLFFRRHRYMFKSTERAALQEIGPRFTLTLKYIKKGTPAVQQYGAAPTALAFDEGADEREAEEERKAADDAGVEVKTDDDAASIGEAEGTEEKAGAGGDASTLHEESLTPKDPLKDEEFLWKWKPELETSRKMFFL